MAEKKTAAKKTAAKKTVAKKVTAKKNAAAKAPVTKSASVKTTAKPVEAKKTPNPLPRTLPQLPWTIPVRTFSRWAMVLIIGISVVGLWLANTLVDARQEDLVAEVKERTAIQASGRAAVVNEWLQGQLGLANNLTNSELMRLFATEMTLNRLAVGAEGDPNSTMRSALVAQMPYMQQTVKELAMRHGLIAAYVLDQKGKAILSSKPLAALSPEQERGVSNLFASRHVQVLGIRPADGLLAMDILKPIFMLDDEDKNPPVSAALLLTVPVNDKLAELLSAGPLAQSGERTALLQKNGLKELVLVTENALQPLTMTEPELLEKTNNTLDPMTSPVDGKSVFATVIPVDHTPFRIMQEYQSSHALSFIDLYRNGVYGMVGLACLALISLTLLVIGHLLAQRNRNRVKHQGQTMEALVRAVEIRDPYLSGHHNRVARLAVTLGNDLDLPVRQRSTLFYAAQLSGIGKIFIHQNIWAKKGKLTEEERREVESHIDHAMTVLHKIDFDLPVADVIRQMYERMDGTGYPAKLKGAEINILSRVLAVCDTYCAMTRPRAYRTAMSEAEAMLYLKNNLNLFDERVVTALAKRVEAV